MADFSTSPPQPGGATFRAPADGTGRLHPAGALAYVDDGTLPAPTPTLVDPLHGVPMVLQAGYTPPFNLTGYGGVAVGPANAVHVQPGTGAVFAISDGGGSVTVDGAVTANLGTVAGLALDATLTGGSQLTKAVGDVASGSADSGAPVKIGGQANSSAPTAVTAGQRVNAWWGLNGQLAVAVGTGSSQGDGSGQVSGFLQVGNTTGQIGTVGSYLYNSATWDRQRNNYEVTALASAARTANVNSADLTNFNARGVNVVLDITAGGGAGSLTVKVTGKDTLSGKYVTLFTSGAIAAPGVSTHVFTVYPGVAAAAYAAGVGKADFPLPRIWRVEVTVGDTTSYTYSVGANYIL